MKEEILMKKSKYSDAQIMSILKQAEGGVPVADLCPARSLARVIRVKIESYSDVKEQLLVSSSPKRVWD